MTYQDDIKELTVTKSLKLLRDGFKNEFATFAYADLRLIKDREYLLENADWSGGYLYAK